MKMKTNLTVENNGNAGAGSALKTACVTSCKKILAQIGAAKANIFAESRAALNGQERILKLALNEAEALAWQTVYPHLLFPALATEKIQAVASWNQHQQSIRRTKLVTAF
jgi:hypothetical protein